MYELIVIREMNYDQHTDQHMLLISCFKRYTVSFHESYLRFGAFKLSNQCFNTFIKGVRSCMAVPDLNFRDNAMSNKGRILIIPQRTKKKNSDAFSVTIFSFQDKLHSHNESIKN